MWAELPPLRYAAGGTAFIISGLAIKAAFESTPPCKAAFDILGVTPFEAAFDPAPSQGKASAGSSWAIGRDILGGGKTILLLGRTGRKLSTGGGAGRPESTDDHAGLGGGEPGVGGGKPMLKAPGAPGGGGGRIKDCCIPGPGCIPGRGGGINWPMGVSASGLCI